MKPAVRVVGCVMAFMFTSCETPGPSLGPPPTHGIASWYGAELAGRPMANGKPFDPARLTCASWFYDFGTRLRVWHGSRSVIVTVTDRGPARSLVREGRIIDLSQAAFARLAPLERGLIRVRLELDE